MEGGSARCGQGPHLDIYLDPSLSIEDNSRCYLSPEIIDLLDLYTAIQCSILMNFPNAILSLAWRLMLTGESRHSIGYISSDYHIKNQSKNGRGDKEINEGSGRQMQQFWTVEGGSSRRSTTLVEYILFNFLNRSVKMTPRIIHLQLSIRYSICP